MRSRRDYIVTKDEVYGYANQWLSCALRLEYEGTRCTASTLLQVLLIAAARVVSICAVCRDLADAPSDQTIRNALAATLPGPSELERRLNRALATKLPKALRRRSRMVAIDLTLIPYHGQPAHNAKEIYRGEPKSGTTHFHAYATAARRAQGPSLHAGVDARRVRRRDEGSGAATVGRRASARREDQVSPAGQRVFQRRGDLLSETGPTRS